jgi:hypothetical protein
MPRNLVNVGERVCDGVVAVSARMMEIYLLSLLADELVPDYVLYKRCRGSGDKKAA